MEYLRHLYNVLHIKITVINILQRHVIDFETIEIGMKENDGKERVAHDSLIFYCSWNLFTVNILLGKREGLFEQPDVLFKTKRR